MKKITLFFALTLAAVGAAFSQTLTVEQFEKQKGDFQNKPVTVTNVTLKVMVATKSTLCTGLKSGEYGVNMSASNTASPIQVCIIGDNKLVLESRKGTKLLTCESIDLMGNEKDGYKIVKTTGLK